MLPTVINVCREELRKAKRAVVTLYEVASDMDARAMYVLAMFFRGR
jgi:hypothetical protein